MSLDQIKVELLSHWGGDRDAANAAWASSADLSKLTTRTDDDVRRVVTQLVNLHHDTPKERVWVEFFITCPIYVERQFDKYRMSVQYQDFQVDFLQAPFGRNGITQNELSGRYRTIPDRHYVMPADVQAILQKSIENPEIEINEYEDLLETQYFSYEATLCALRDAEKEGKITNKEYKRVREVYRGVLGTAYMTDMRIVMNLNAFEHIINQRLAPDAQLESRAVALGMIRALQSSNCAAHMLNNMIIVNNWDTMIKDYEEQKLSYE